MAVPSCNPADLLVTDGAETLLLFPKVAQPSFSFQRSSHLHVQSLLKVRLPGRVVGIGFCADFRMPFDVDLRSREEPYHSALPILLLEDSGEHPTVGASSGKVFVLDPPARFVAMSAQCPGPDGLEDRMIDGVKDGLTHHMTVVQSPSTYLWIQFRDQFSGRQVPALLDALSDLAEERLDVLLRWCDEELGAFPPLVLAYGLSQEVKTLLDMRDDGFLW